MTNCEEQSSSPKKGEFAMTCIKCGAPNELASFCTRCGGNVQASGTQMQQSPELPVPQYAPQYTPAGAAQPPAYAPQPQPQQPYYQQQPQYAYPQQPQMAPGPVYADFIVRFFACLVDEFIAFSAAGLAYGVFILLALVLGAIFGGKEGGWLGVLVGFFGGSTAALLAYIVYFVKLETGPGQATLGKQMMGIKVCNSTGGRISVLQSLGRLIVKDTFSILFFMAGFIMAAFTEKKQALHDFVASTYVVKA